MLPLAMHSAAPAAVRAGGATPQPEQVREAAHRLHGLVRRTPLLRSDYLSDTVGRPVYLKLENLQATGSFKVRGALAALTALTPQQRQCGVVTASAGNHGLGVAWAARQLGLQATVVVPTTAVAPKVTGLHRLGARVALHGDGYDAAHSEALRLAEASGWPYIHAFADPWVIAGQGTAALEVLHDLPGARCLIVPVGGGGLLAGALLAARGLDHPVDLVGAQAEGADVMARSLRAGHVVPDGPVRPTLADGLAGSIEEITFDLCHGRVHEMALVDEDDILDAMAVLLRHDHIVAEGSGAVGVAALLRGRVDLPADGPVVALISGGNVAAESLSRALHRRAG